ncbi:hypothetical protein [Hoeflea sp.]|uniref:hypothetical protein n=1 Tax=Hoeflea sp. TaxID=1940281 RepID=UPI003B023D48
MGYVVAMGQSGDSVKPKSSAEARKERLAAELRANLQRRKGQTRARRKGAMDEADGLPGSQGDERP